MFPVGLQTPGQVLARIAEYLAGNSATQEIYFLRPWVWFSWWAALGSYGACGSHGVFRVFDAPDVNKRVSKKYDLFIRLCPLLVVAQLAWLAKTVWADFFHFVRTRQYLSPGDTVAISRS